MSENKIIDDLAQSLGKQKTLFQVYIAYRSLGRTKFNKIVILIVTSLTLVMLLAKVPNFDSTSVQKSYMALAKVSGIIFTYSVGIIGFLIASVAILVSTNDKDLFVVMAKAKYKSDDGQYTEYSQFQFIFFNLLIALVFHLILLSASGLSLFLTTDGNFFFEIDFLTQLLPDLTLYAINSVYLIVFLSFFTRCLLLVKSSIWNIYQTVILTVLWANEKPREKTQDNKCP